MIPTAALDLLKFDTEDAEETAARGDARAGYDLLAAGLRRAEAARDAGFAWGEELTHRYQEMIERYAERHGLSGSRASELRGDR